MGAGEFVCVGGGVFVYARMSARGRGECVCAGGSECTVCVDKECVSEDECMWTGASAWVQAGVSVRVQAGASVRVQVGASVCWWGE